MIIISLFLSSEPISKVRQGHLAFFGLHKDFCCWMTIIIFFGITNNGRPYTVALSIGCHVDRQHGFVWIDQVTNIVQRQQQGAIAVVVVVVAQ
jgi:hypothetical protein